MNEKIMIAAGFNKEVESVKNKYCPFCEQPVVLKDFKTELSVAEYRISGICQKCQVKIFGE